MAKTKNPRARQRLLCAVCLSFLGSVVPPVGAQSEDESLAKIRSMAESQHEIVMLLLKKKEYNRVVPEACKIFEMQWPPQQEPLLLKELLYFTDQFLHEGKADLGLKLLELNLGAFKTRASLVAIWKEKGYLYKKMDQLDKALEAFREAQRVEQESP